MTFLDFSRFFCFKSLLILFVSCVSYVFFTCYLVPRQKNEITAYTGMKIKTENVLDGHMYWDYDCGYKYMYWTVKMHLCTLVAENADNKGSCHTIRLCA